MRLDLVLTTGSLIFLVGCSNMKKQEPVATATPPAAPQAVAPAAPPVAAKTELAQESITCKRDSDVRTLEVEVLQPKGCKLLYSRFGNKNSVASSEKATTHCEQVRDRIQKNLEVVDFKCTAGAISTEKSPEVKAAAPAVTPKPSPDVKAASSAPASPAKEVAKPAPAATAPTAAAPAVPVQKEASASAPKASESETQKK